MQLTGEAIEDLSQKRNHRTLIHQNNIGINQRAAASKQKPRVKEEREKDREIANYNFSVKKTSRRLNLRVPSGSVFLFLSFDSKLSPLSRMKSLEKARTPCTYYGSNYDVRVVILLILFPEL